jgi:hypothetical protein
MKVAMLGAGNIGRWPFQSGWKTVGPMGGSI